MDFMISLFGNDSTTGKPKEKRQVKFGIAGNALKNRRKSRHAELPPENEEGNIEYKLKLIDPSPSRFQHLVTQLKWRLREGQGEAIYEIGVEDSGILAGLTDREMQASLSTLRRMAHSLGASMTVLREHDVFSDFYTGETLRRRMAEVLIRKVPDYQEFIDLRIAVLGCADAGKSTLLGVITQGEMDNGKGRARLNLFRHLHEIQTGRTSSISLDVVGFDSEGAIISQQEHSIEEILENSSKLVTFIDLAGHQKYLKTTIFGLTGYRPHFVMLVVAANMGVVGTTREHIGLAMALEVPIFVVISKLDLVTPQTLDNTLRQLERVLKGPGCKRVPTRVETEDDAINAGINFHEQKLVPIFMLSSVTGENLDVLFKFFNVLPASQTVSEREILIQEEVEFHVDEVFNVHHVGLVAAGLLTKGVIREGDEVLVGPTQTGEFRRLEVDSIHRNKAACRVVQAGQAASLAFTDLKDIQLRKGMAVLSTEQQAKACYEFEADVYMLYHPVNYVCRGFQTTVHMGNLCQTATIAEIESPHKCLSTTESAKVRFRFLKQPEFVTVGSRFLFREGKTKGIGHVTRIIDGQ